MGLRIGAARRIPTNTTTNAASNSTTRRKEDWRSAVVMVSPMPDLPSWGFLEASFTTLSLSVCAWLGCQTRCTVFSTYLEWSLLLLTQPSSRLGSQSSVALQPPFPNRLPRLAHSDGAVGDVAATAGSLASFGVRR